MRLASARHLRHSAHSLALTSSSTSPATLHCPSTSALAGRLPLAAQRNSVGIFWSFTAGCTLRACREGGRGAAPRERGAARAAPRRRAVPSGEWGPPPARRPPPNAPRPVRRVALVLVARERHGDEHDGRLGARERRLDHRLGVGAVAAPGRLAGAREEHQHAHAGLAAVRRERRAQRGLVGGGDARDAGHGGAGEARGRGGGGEERGCAAHAAKVSVRESEARGGHQSPHTLGRREPAPPPPPPPPPPPRSRRSRRSSAHPAARPATWTCCARTRSRSAAPS